MPELIQEIDWYLARLEGVEGGQGEYTAWCPCHDDVGTEWKGLSLSVKGKKLLGKCHSCGATLPDIFKALSDVDENEDWELNVNVHTRTNGSTPDEVDYSDLGRGMAWWVDKTGVPPEVWEKLGCVESEGGVAFLFADEPTIRKMRKPPKEIVWVGTSGADAPPLWPMPDAQLPDHAGIFEGESDGGTATAAGIVDVAYAVTKGAKAPLPTGWADALKDRGVTRLTICGDTDDGGFEMRNRLSREAVAAGLSVEVIRLETVLDPFSGINDLNGVWKACETVEEFQQVVARATQRVAERMTFRTVNEMEEIAKQKVDWLIPELIAPGDKIILAAPQKSMKSFLALSLTRSLVTGAAFLKRPEWIPETTRRVGFVQEEGAPSLWARRVYMLRITDNENAIFSHRTGFRFTESAYVDELISAARDARLDMLILDPLQRMTPGIDENSSSEVGVVWDEVFRIQQALPHLVVMLVHHANRTGALNWTSIRGSSRHGGEVDLGIFIEKHPIEERRLRMWLDGRDIPEYLGTGEVFEVKYEIDRDARLIDFDGTEITVNVSASAQLQGRANRDKVFAAVSNGKETRKEIMAECELSENTVKEHLLALIEEGAVIEHAEKGKARRYEIRKDET